MPQLWRIFAGVTFSVVSTLALMFFVSRFPGMDIPPAYWLFGAVCPALISTPVCIIFVRQGEQNRRLTRDLSEALDALARASEIDPMTRLLNRASFMNKSQQHGGMTRGWLLLIDVDHFKAINDSYGHDIGDQVLERIGAALAKCVRSTDLCGRIGGEEFAICLVGVDRQHAQVTAERVRRDISELVVHSHDGDAIRPTVSIGVADAADPVSIKRALRRADQAMYEAKRSGRNRVMFAPTFRDEAVYAFA